MLFVLAFFGNTLNAQAQTPPPWSLGGNTPSATHFLGTTNASDLIFKTNDLQRMTLKSTGFLGLGTAEPKGWQEILYCPPPGIPQTGLIVTREECHPTSGIVAVPDLGLPDFIGGGLTLGPGTGNPPENNNDPNNFNLPFTFLTGHSTNQLTPTYSADAPLFWVRAQFPANSMNNSGPADRYETKMIVMPDGSCGINIAQPRAALDVRGSQVQNRPAAIFGSRALGTGGPTGPNGLLQYYTQMIQMVPNLKFRGYNSISKAGDMGILFSDGKGAEGANLNGALVIAPWSIGNGADSTVGGLRIDQNGNLGVGVATTNGFKMAVNGDVTINGSFYCKNELRVQEIGVSWPDYVFEEYSKSKILPYNLKELENFVLRNHHLPEIPSAEAIKVNGFSLVESYCSLLKQVEVLTLMIIKLNNDLEELSKNK